MLPIGLSNLKAVNELQHLGPRKKYTYNAKKN